MTDRQIPDPLIGVLAEVLVEEYPTRGQLEPLFLRAGAPDVQPPLKNMKLQSIDRLRETNKRAADPLGVVGRLVQDMLETDDQSLRLIHPSFIERRERLRGALSRHKLIYTTGGFLRDASAASAPIVSLEYEIRGRDLPALQEEFRRALQSIEPEPREAASAA